MIAAKHVAAQSQGRPTFIDLDKPSPNQTFTVVFWERDKVTVGLLPSNGQLCVSGTITQYRGGAQKLSSTMQPVGTFPRHS